MANNFLTFLTESGNDTQTVGGFASNREENSFDSAFAKTYEDLMAESVNPMMDTATIVNNPAIFETYKKGLLSSVEEFCERANDRFEDGSATDVGNFANIYNQISDMFDNCREDFIKESTKVGSLLPIKMVDFPLIVKQQLKVVSKDILQAEVTKSPVIKKHIERSFIVDNQTGKRWEYPQCFFKDDFQEIYDAGKGYKIKDTPVDVPCMDFDIVTLTDAPVAGRESISINTKIIACVLEDGTKFPVNMRIDLANGMWQGGLFKDKEITKADGSVVTVNDCITGYVDFVTNTTTVSSASGQIKQVIFGGYLSNDLNERTVGFDWQREEREWKIEDGHRVDIPWSIEDLEDAKALLDIDLYQKSYSRLTDYLVQMEDANCLKFLDDEFKKYDGVELDPLGFNPIIRKQSFDCDSTIATVALPCEYIEKQLKFQIDRFIIDICDTTKMEDLTFVCYGNPRYISLLSPNVNWVVKNGDMVGGVKLNYAYGIMTSGGVKVQVVSTNKIDSKKMPGLRFIPYPLNKEQMTFKHYKYVSHILTHANSAYRAADRPGGSYTNIVGVSRYTNASVQGIQGHMDFTNDNFILKN